MKTYILYVDASNKETNFVWAMSEKDITLTKVTVEAETVQEAVTKAKQQL